MTGTVCALSSLVSGAPGRSCGCAGVGRVSEDREGRWLWLQAWGRTSRAGCLEPEGLSSHPRDTLFRGRLAGALERPPLSRAYGHSDTERERDRVSDPPGPDVGHAGETHTRAPWGQSRLSTPDTRRRLIRAPIHMAGRRRPPRVHCECPPSGGGAFSHTPWAWTLAGM